MVGVAAAVPSFVGFAVGRAVFGSVGRLARGLATLKQEVGGIAGRHRTWLQRFRHDLPFLITTPLAPPLWSGQNLAEYLLTAHKRARKTARWYALARSDCTLCTATSLPRRPTPHAYAPCVRLPQMQQMHGLS